MTTPESEPRDPNIIDMEVEIAFGDTARARSDWVLGNFGKQDEGTGQITYTWQVGWEWHKKFTLSRPVGEVNEDTVYSLEFEDLTGAGDSGRYDYSQRNCLHETTEIANRSTKEYFAQQLGGMSASEVHQGELLDYLGSVEKQGTGF
jgi:hypothetical protein